jgi:DNA-damage-inducible protein D
MENGNLPAQRTKTFEELKQANQFGAEYWSARDLQPMLGYNHWRSFENAIKKAIVSCEKSGNEPGHHFARARKVIIVCERAFEPACN